jgi:osmotically inducible protein OsmC
MAEILRKAGVIWNGDLKTGNGLISTESQALFQEPYTFGTRFENEEGTNPEELIAAAHAACYSMALASTLKKKGYNPERVDTNATITMTSKNGGFKITKILLHVRGQVPGIDAVTFKEISNEADLGCPVSNLLRPGLEIEHEVELV